MRCPGGSAVLAIAILVSYAAAIIKLPIARRSEPNTRRQDISARDPVFSVLHNNITGGSYYIEVEVGTPGQKITLAVDTGSSDVWVLSSTADLCTKPSLQFEYGGCSSTFDSTASSTFTNLESEFSIQYLDQSGADGEYITDTLQLGGVSIKEMQMGFATSATVPTGLMGIGYSLNEASNNPENIVPFTYPSIIDQMVAQGLIARKAYSLYLDDLESATGSIIFGGLDADKYHGDLLQMPVVPTKLRNGSTIYAELGVALTSFGITGQHVNTANLTSSTFKEVVILDSGTTITYLPKSLVAQIYQQIGAIDDSKSSGSGMVYVDCNIRSDSPDLTFNYGFGGASGLSIAIPIDEVVFDLKDLFAVPSFTLPPLPFASPCGFGIWSGGTTGPFILGDTFLRSAYVVYDLQSNIIAIAQTNFNSSSSSVVEFKATETSIPNVSGLASSVDVTASDTGVLPGIGGGKTSATGLGTTAASSGGSGSSATPTSSSSTGASTSKSAGVAAVPAFDGRRLSVLGIAGLFAMLGGGWLLS